MVEPTSCLPDDKLESPPPDLEDKSELSDEPEYDLRIAGVDSELSGRDEVAIMPESSDFAMLFLMPYLPPLVWRTAPIPGDLPGIEVEGTWILVTE